MTDHAWRLDAKCLGQPTELFDVDRLPTSVKRTAAARALWAGCPVIRNCAKDALANLEYSIGYVVAGVAMPSATRHLGKPRKRLEAVLHEPLGQAA